MPDPELHGIYLSRLSDKDEGIREAAAEGIARLKNPDDLPKTESAFSIEKKTGPRLSFAFALASLGKRDMGELAPLRYLVNSLNSAAYRGVSRAYLTELARDPATRSALYPVLTESTATKEEKTGLAQVLSVSGDRESIAPLEALVKDSSPDVSQEATRALRFGETACEVNGSRKRNPIYRRVHESSMQHFAQYCSCSREQSNKR